MAAHRVDITKYRDTHNADFESEDVVLRPMNRSLSSFFRLDETFIYSVFVHSGRFIVDPEITVDAIFKQYDKIDKFYIFDCKNFCQ